MKHSKPKAMKYIYLALIFAAFTSCQSSTGKTDDASAVNAPQVVLKLAPKENNPRNSEGAFVTLNDGRILFVYSHYTGTGSGDHDPAYLAGRYSDDGGKTWTSEDELIVDREGDMNVMSVSLLRLQNGDIALFYLKKNSTEDCIPLMRISKDEAKTWSEPITCITDKQGYFVLNNDRVIQLENGRLLMAVALHATPGEGTWNDKAKLYSYYSDDNGQTWKSGEEVPTPADIITQEPGVVELKDGSVLMYIRASGGTQLFSYSTDKGVSWSAAEPSSMNSPLSPATIKRIPKTGDLLGVWNNNDGSDESIKGKRTPLSIGISKDEGKTWEKIKDIETDPDGWYCYMAMHFTDNDLLLGYCAGSQKEKTHLSVTDITKLNVDWVYQ